MVLLPPVAKTRKLRNVRAGNQKVAIVLDDMVWFDPFIVIRATALLIRRSNASNWSGRAYTRASHPLFHGAGTSNVSPPASPGTRPEERSMSSRPGRDILVVYCSRGEG
jgi:hypothetical protein